MVESCVSPIEALGRVTDDGLEEPLSRSALWWLGRYPSGDAGRSEAVIRIDLEAEMQKFADEAGISYEAARAEVEDLIAQVHAKESLGTTSTVHTRASRW